MENAKKKLKVLIAIGNEFTYENFSEKGNHGYPSSLTPDYIAWETRCNGIIVKLFGENSAQDNAMKKAMETEVIEWAEDKFQIRRNSIIGTLKTSLEILEDDIFNELNQNEASAPGKLSNKIFVVHGHDDAAKSSLEIFLTEIGLEPIVLHRQADEGQTIIEKFEKHSDVGYAFILLTPDEIAYLKSEADKPEKDRQTEYRARPNVIFEFGYFVGRLGRPRVCCLYTGDVVLPTDVSGMIYKKFNNSVDEVAYSIIKDLKTAGYKLK
jgi:predicted nucleotide-binding protein